MTFRMLVVALVLAAIPMPGAAQVPGPQTASSVPSSPTFDVEAAVHSYLATVPPDARARSDAYFEGGYWIILWDFLYGAAVALLILNLRLSARIRDFAERATRLKPVRTFVYWACFVTLTSVLTFPLTIYEGFFRERSYGLLNQTFPDWIADQAKTFLVGLLFGGIVVVLLFGIVRRLARTWWLWATAASVIFIMIALLIGPVYIAPLFNRYTPLRDERVRQPILSMARANGIPVTDVWEVDASRQSKRVSANVSGFLGTERITLNDNLLTRCTLPEIETVMGHEIGHYVLNHIYKGILFFGVLALAFFAFLRRTLDWTLARWGKNWGIRDVADVAVLPLVVLLGSSFFLALTPVTNTWIRTQEYEADIFGLNAAGQPDGEAKVDLMLGEYRKLDPGPLEEFIFFDHPSGRTRITAAMRWKAEHLNDPAR
jgi:STE24 endopeptidase